MADKTVISRSSKKSYLIVSICFIAFGTTIALLTSLINYQMQYTNIDSELQARFEREKAYKIEKIKQSVDALEHVVGSLAQNPMMLAYIQTQSANSLQNVRDLFLAAASSHPEFIQVRYIDAKGMEQIRIQLSQGGSHAEVVPDAQLQNKRDRYYFLETSSLPARQYWHSNIDLNVEHGEIERPLRPTFRVATPIYHNNRLAGIVIINTEAKRMLTELSLSADFKVVVIDGKGEILRHFDKDLSWSQYLDNKQSFIEMHPVVGPKLLHSPNRSITGFFSFSISDLFKNNEKLQVVMLPKQEAISQLVQSNLFAAIVIASIVLIISFPLSWLAAMIPSRLQSELRYALEDLRRTNEVVDRYVMSCTTDLNGNIKNASSAYCEATGYALWELEGHTHHLIRHSETSNETYQDLWRTIQSGKSWNGELHNITKAGKEYWVYCVISPERNALGDVVGYTQICQDISDRKEIEKLSVTDVLTQVFNRRKLDLRLSIELERFIRYQHYFSVIMLDLDHFKKINDTYGHQAGDDVLVKTAETIRSSIREVDCVGRWGGEEFLIICSGTDGYGAVNLAEKLREALQAMAFSFPLTVTASFGVGQSEFNEPLNQLLARVDKALYDAKSEGRNRVKLAGYSSTSSLKNEKS